MSALQLIIASINLAFTVQQTVLALSPPIVEINNNNRIIGTVVTFDGIPVHQYLGVRYAQPPLGPQLFAKPLPALSYSAVTERPPPCFQDYFDWFPWLELENRSMNCLYLNVWAPVGASRWNKKAVMYWIHGGEFRTGGISFPYHNGARLAALGNIIVVTVNFRLGLPGFFTTNSPSAPGNAGVWDVLEGLKWVNQYIPAFGGDASRITIAGWDSGAVTVGLLSISPLSKGLYARQIMQSGSPAYRRFDNNSQDFLYSMQIADSMGCVNRFNPKTKKFFKYTVEETVSCLRFNRGSSVLLGKERQFSHNKTWHFLPQFGDELLPENPRLSVIKNNFRCTDLLIGSNRDEGNYLGTTSEYRNYQHDLTTLAEKIIRKHMSYFPDPEAILKYYLPPTLKNTTRRISAAYTAYGDTVVTCPTVYYAEKCAEQKKNVYYYQFNHTSADSPWGDLSNIAGIAHFDEVPFVFGNPLDNMNSRNQTYPLSEKILSKQIIYIWSNFVKYGRPGIPWPLYSKEKPFFKYVGSPDYVTYQNGKGPQTENCNFLRPHFGF